MKNNPIRQGDDIMRNIKKIIFLMLVSVVALIICGCHSAGITVSTGESEQLGPPPWAPAHGYRAKYKYYYYPNACVYFDIGRRLYFYYQDEQWKVSVSLPQSIHITTEEYVVLEMDTDKPYKFHSDVVKRYPPGQIKKYDKEKNKRKNK